MCFFLLIKLITGTVINLVLKCLPRCEISKNKAVRILYSLLGVKH